MNGPIIGVDEVGLGSWAGPLVVCAFAAPSEEWILEKLDDSKKVSKSNRSTLAKALMRDFPQSYVLITGGVSDIDTHGIEKTWRRAMELAVERLIAQVGVPWRVIIDGNKQPVMGAECYPKADGKFPCVMAASVIAKVHRDTHMMEEAVKYPQYGFDRHAGYGTAQHRSALMAHGLSPIHRRSYEPMSSLLAG